MYFLAFAFKKIPIMDGDLPIFLYFVGNEGFSGGEGDLVSCDGWVAFRLRCCLAGFDGRIRPFMRA